MHRALAPLLILTGFGYHAFAGPADTAHVSVADMQKQVTAPRIFAVSAYVVRKDDTCPPCPPQAVCETCVYGILIADRPDAPATEGLYLMTPRAKQFHAGSKYIFRIRYRIERNAAGAWQLEGPDLLGADPPDNR